MIEDDGPPSTARQPATLESLHDLVLKTFREMRHYRSELIAPDGALERLYRKLETEMHELREQVADGVLRIGLLEHPAAVEPVETRVLAVDDEPALLRTIERVLGAHGIKVRCASGGADALDIIQHDRIDVVLSDMTMPGNGSTLCEHLTTEFPEVVVILMTGFDAKYAAERALHLGAFGFLVKPFELDELVLKAKNGAELARARRARAGSVR